MGRGRPLSSRPLHERIRTEPQPFFSANASLIFARGVALILTFVSATDGLTRAFDWLRSAELARSVDRRLETIRAGQQEPLLAIFADLRGGHHVRASDSSVYLPGREDKTRRPLARPEGAGETRLTVRDQASSSSGDG